MLVEVKFKRDKLIFGLAESSIAGKAESLVEVKFNSEKLSLWVNINPSPCTLPARLRGGTGLWRCLW